MKASIKDFWQKIKGFFFEMKEEILVCFIIIFVGLASFGLGRLSVGEEQSGEIRILNQQANAHDALETETEAQAKALSEESSALVVASKSGKKYHYPWCTGAKQIAEKNKITFQTIEEARVAGYTPAANCKGLK